MKNEKINSQQTKNALADEEATLNCNRSGNEGVGLNQYQNSPYRNKIADNNQGVNLNKEISDEEIDKEPKVIFVKNSDLLDIAKRIKKDEDALGVEDKK